MAAQQERRSGLDRRQYDSDLPAWMEQGEFMDRRKSGNVSATRSGSDREMPAPFSFDDVPSMDLLPELVPLWRQSSFR